MRLTSQNRPKGYFLFVMLFVLFGCYGQFAQADYPPPGSDKLGADIEMLVDIEGQQHTLKASGSVVIQRGTPAIGSVTTTIPIEIVSLDLSGTSTLGVLRLRESPTLPSKGRSSQRQPESEMVLDSFFDIFTEIELGGGLATVHNGEATHLDDVSDTQSIPFTRLMPATNSATPQEVYNPFDSGPVSIPLLDANNNPTGITLLSCRIIFWPWVDCYHTTCSLLYVPLNPAGPPRTVVLTGNSRVIRSSCFFQTPGGSQQTISTELHACDLNQETATGIRLRESPTKGSPGRLRSTTGDFPAQSFFDVFFDIAVTDTDPALSLFNRQGAILQADPVSAMPFEGVTHNLTNAPIQLFSSANPEGEPVALIEQMSYTFVRPIFWWYPWWSIYIIKLNPLGIPIPSIPFDLFSGISPDLSKIAQGQTGSNGLLDFTNLSLGHYTVQENLPPGYEAVTPPEQQVDLSSIDYSPDFYRGFGGEFPCAGTDRIQVGMGCELEVPELGVANVTFNGTAEIQRSAVGDLDGDGTLDIQTELVSMDLTAPNPLGKGTLRLRESPTRPSTGRIVEEAAGENFPADSFFDIFFEMDLPSGGSVQSFTPTHISKTGITQIPSIGEIHSDNGTDTELKVEPAGPTLARIRRIWWVPIPWYEYVLIYINNPPKPTPTPTATATSTVTPTPTDIPKVTPTPTETPKYFLKWSQPPALNPESPVRDCFWGWDEFSIYDPSPFAGIALPDTPHIMADDFLCSDHRPITDIHWWGSYIGWDGMEPPPNNVVGYHIGIWTDVPKSADQPWSHPDEMICGWTVGREKLNERYVGCDFIPGKPNDSCFRYDFLIPQAEWCYQPEQQAVLWVSISAIYGPPSGQNYFWGWKTREYIFNDVAVMIFAPLTPVIGSVFQQGQPLPGPDGTVSWDMAFEITTNEEIPTPSPTKQAASTSTPTATVTQSSTSTPRPTDTLTATVTATKAGTSTPTNTPRPTDTLTATVTATKAGTSTPTSTREGTSTATPTEILKVTETPTETPRSFLKWSQPPVRNPESPFPDCFWGWDEFSIYDPSPLAGIALPDTPHIMADDFLCSDNRPITDIHWWGSYIGWNGTEPPPNNVVGFHIGIWTDVPKDAAQAWSHPGHMICGWTVARGKFNEKYVGCDFIPGKPNDSCFRYDFLIPQNEWCFQPEQQAVLWVSISAIYGAPTAQNYFWGWKTRKHFFNDVAVMILAPLAPTIGSSFQQGQPLTGPDGTADWDMAFAITTNQTGPTPTLTPTPVGGVIDSDGDGVSDGVEDQGPNGGDSNNDGVPDKQQAHVASLPNSVDGRFLTLTAAEGHAITGLHAIDPTTLENPPSGHGFPFGLITFEIAGAEAGQDVTVELVHPADTQVNSYLKYGRTLSDLSPHWYEFLFDGETGAEISPGKALLHFRDGQRGDEDLIKNGVVWDPSGPSGGLVLIIDWIDY